MLYKVPFLKESLGCLICVHQHRRSLGRRGFHRLGVFFVKRALPDHSGENCAVALRAFWAHAFRFTHVGMATQRLSLPFQSSFKTSYQTSPDYLVAKSLGGQRQIALSRELFRQVSNLLTIHDAGLAIARYGTKVFTPLRLDKGRHAPSCVCPGAAVGRRATVATTVKENG